MQDGPGAQALWAALLTSLQQWHVRLGGRRLCQPDTPSVACTVTCSSHNVQFRPS